MFGFGFTLTGSRLGTLAIIALGLTVVATLAAYVFILPEKRRDALSKCLQKLRDVLTFQTPPLEAILRALYIFATLYCVLSGLFMLFTSFWTGLNAVILGPVLLRITFELLMMFVRLVKNTAEINARLGGCCEPPEDQPEEQPETAAPAPVKHGPDDKFCKECGSTLDQWKKCPNGCDK